MICITKEIKLPIKTFEFFVYSPFVVFDDKPHLVMTKTKELSSTNNVTYYLYSEDYQPDMSGKKRLSFVGKVIRGNYYPV